MASITLDKTDLEILQVSQGNSHLTNVEPSERIALSSPSCLHRLKQLEDADIIRKYATLLPPVAIELGLQAFIRVSISKAKVAYEGFPAIVQTWPEVLSRLALADEIDYLLRAFFADMNAFSHSVLDTLFLREGVQNTQSGSILKEIKNITTLPLTHLQCD